MMGQRIRALTDVDLYIGRKIHSYRNQAKLSQQRLGELMGVSFQMIQRYEQGLNRLGASRVQQAAEIFKCPIADFFPPHHNGNHKKKEVSNLDRVAATRDGMKLIDAFVAIKSETLRGAVVDLATKFVVYEAKGKRD